MRFVSLKPFLALIVMAALAAPAAAQKMYRWVDKDGKVHFGQSIPPEYAEQANETINEDGITVRRQERAKTAAERAAEAEAARLAAEQRRAEERQEAEDRRLMATYETREDIIQTRDSRLDALDRTIVASQASVSAQSRDLAKLMERAAELAAAGKPVGDKLQVSIDQVQSDILMQEAFIAEKNQEKEDIAAHYDAELARYDEIVARREAARQARLAEQNAD